MKEVYDKARELMKGYCRVCPECNGKACVGEVPGMGGLGTASAFKDNLDALKEFRFNMRLVHSVTEPDTPGEHPGREPGAAGSCRPHWWDFL